MQCTISVDLWRELLVSHSFHRPSSQIGQRLEIWHPASIMWPRRLTAEPFRSSDPLADSPEASLSWGDRVEREEQAEAARATATAPVSTLFLFLGWQITGLGRTWWPRESVVVFTLAHPKEPLGSAEFRWIVQLGLESPGGATTSDQWSGTGRLTKC